MLGWLLLLTFTAVLQVTLLLWNMLPDSSAFNVIYSTDTNIWVCSVLFRPQLIYHLYCGSDNSSLSLGLLNVMRLCVRLYFITLGQNHWPVLYGMYGWYTVVILKGGSCSPQGCPVCLHTSWLLLAEGGCKCGPSDDHQTTGVPHEFDEEV